MKVMEALRWAEGELRELESPRLEAEILLYHVMKWKRHHLYLNHIHKICMPDLKRYREVVDRRKNREPLQHITGEVEFLGRTFIAEKGALIARPETEYLTELFMRELSSPEYILDVGTGSGVIALSIALEFPDASVIATDISRDALLVAQRNRDLFKIDNLLLASADLLNAFRLDTHIFDGVIANLPYIPSHQIIGLEPEVSKGDPHIALDGGADGLELVLSLIDSVHGIIRKSGILVLELGEEQVKKVSEILESIPHWKNVRQITDLAGRPRAVTARAN